MYCRHSFNRCWSSDTWCTDSTYLPEAYIDWQQSGRTVFIATPYQHLYDAKQMHELQPLFKKRPKIRDTQERYPCWQCAGNDYRQFIPHCFYAKMKCCQIASDSEENTWIYAFLHIFCMTEQLLPTENLHILSTGQIDWTSCDRHKAYLASRLQVQAPSQPQELLDGCWGGRRNGKFSFQKILTLPLASYDIEGRGGLAMEKGAALSMSTEAHCLGHNFYTNILNHDM